MEEVAIRINYFHGSSDDYLRALGVDRALLPTRDDWFAFHEEDYRRPMEDRLNYSLIWELNCRIVGFSSTDRITFGNEAFMHLHILDPANRRQGLGVQFVKESARVYFDVLQLEQLFCEPNAFNVAPNRTLQAAGFRYLFTHEAQPGPINYLQITTQWVMTRGDLSA